MSEWWNVEIVGAGKLPMLLCFLAFVVTFLATRGITRMIRAGRGPFRNNVTSSGVHIHHAVPGLGLLLIGAFVALSAEHGGFRATAGVLVGVGASLVLDEFALILHLSDVYWSQEGQASVQAVALTASCLALVLLGFTPARSEDLTGGQQARWALALSIALTVLACLVCVAKGKYRLIVLAICVPAVAFVGAVRLARPGSPWFRKHYAAGSRKATTATRRTAELDATWGRRWGWIADAIAGAPSQPNPAAKP
ncbi:hypothetical protein FB554_0218 [Barrientosiimonas humi]|uniref:Integral membrane protein n=1 Tax=Barrientosiimonas humi TaxID=999931 RepID=A0A542X8D4_9MICO|nr:hypothetical protein [Barrientosiimonas humi]TQL32103.1 hypothetical protein FB554_0218 [Barrientosiimonas humi]CAG7572092.1 hypothetical protein BH39T_PBIAJDOK_00702 [Barrientosiimonas humi]